MYAFDSFDILRARSLESMCFFSGKDIIYR